MPYSAKPQSIIGINARLSELEEEKNQLLALREQLQQPSPISPNSMGVTPSSVGIKSFKSRWGSCHVNGDIVFNWKIVMAPNRIVDYVVVHELCHLKHHDHSPKFWKAVEKVIPDYKDCKRWLKDNATRQSV